MHSNIYTTDAQNVLPHVSALSRCHPRGACAVCKVVLEMYYIYIPVDVRLGFRKLVSTLRTVHAILKWSLFIVIYPSARVCESACT